MPTNDYRDDLRSILEDSGLSRRQICKKLGVQDSTLSNVLAKRRNLSVEKLQDLLDVLGYRISFASKTDPQLSAATKRAQMAEQELEKAEFYINTHP